MVLVFSPTVGVFVYVGSPSRQSRKKGGGAAQGRNMRGREVGREGERARGERGGTVNAGGEEDGGL